MTTADFIRTVGAVIAVLMFKPSPFCFFFSSLFRNGSLLRNSHLSAACTHIWKVPYLRTDQYFWFCGVFACDVYIINSQK